jgi:hypothetical protein
MKITPIHQKSGSALIVTLCTVLIISVVITSYLGLVNNQNASVSRDQSWNAAIPVLESGIEEALTQIYFNGYTNLNTNGWTYDGTDHYYHKTRTFTDGSYFSVAIQPTNPPIIYSTGFVALTMTSSSSSTNYVKRTVRVNTVKARGGGGGLNAKGAISFGGNGSLDSFDSSDPNYSSNGMYVASMRTANAKALTDATNAGAISMGNGTIYGSTVTGPSGTVTFGNGSVGDSAWVASHSGAEAGHTANDANVQFNDVAAPFTYGSGITPSSGTYAVSGTNYSYKLTGGNYNLPGGTSLSGGTTMIVTGNTVLYVNGSFSIAGNAFIYIAPGASLKIYIDGAGSFGGGGVANGTGYASNLSIYGTATSASMSYAGNASFVGSVYAPDADFTFSGTADATGSFTAKTVSVSGGASIHYDQSLDPANRQFVVSSWNEI